MTQRTTSFWKKALTKQHVSALLASSLSRLHLKHGKGALADHLEVTPKTLDNAMTGKTVPEGLVLINLLAADPTALDEVLAAIGLRVTPLKTEAANDFHTAADLAKAAGTFIDALSDGHRCHNETLALGAIFRDLLPRINGIVSEADSIRTGRAA